MRSSGGSGSAHEGEPRDALVGLDVALRGLAAHRVGQRGRRAVALVALLRVPAPHELLVHRLRIGAVGHRALVGVEIPVPRRVGRVDLVDHGERAGVVETELVLGVDQDQALLLGPLLAFGEEPQHQRLGAVVERARRSRPDAIAASREVELVVRALLRLGGGRQQRARQPLVLAQALGQPMAAVDARRRASRRSRSRCR